VQRCKCQFSGCSQVAECRCQVMQFVPPTAKRMASRTSSGDNGQRQPWIIQRLTTPLVRSDPTSDTRLHATQAERLVDSKDPDRDPAAGWHAAATGSSSIGRWSREAPGPTSRRRVPRITFADPPGIVFRDSGAPKEAELHHACRDLSGVTGARDAVPPAWHRCLQVVLADNERLHLIRNLWI